MTEWKKKKREAAAAAEPGSTSLVTKLVFVRRRPQERKTTSARYLSGTGAAHAVYARTHARTHNKPGSMRRNDTRPLTLNNIRLTS